MELGVGISLAVVLAFVAVFFGLRQRVTLTLARSDPQLTAEERTFYVQQVRRRLVCSLLLLVLAGMLVGSFFIGDAGTHDMAEDAAPSPEVKAAVRFLTGYWISALLLVLAIMFVASLDFLATARYGMRRVRQLENDRRAALEQEVARLRQRRRELN